MSCASIQPEHHRSYPDYFLLGAALKIPEKAANPCIGNGFLNEVRVQRGLQGVYSLLSLSHWLSYSVQLHSSKPRASRLVLTQAAWQSVTVTAGARFRGGGKSMECCLAASPFRETSHEGAARFEMAPYLARSSSDPKSSPFNKTVLPHYFEDHFKLR